MDNTRIEQSPTATRRPAGSTHTPGISDEAKAGFGFMLMGIVVVAMLGLGIWLWASENQAIDRLPVATRHALYERTLSTLSEFCDPKKALRGLDAYCHQQADFVAAFPECGDSCRALATQHHRLAAR